MFEAYQMISTDIRIVLVEPSHPGNIGAVARAMKNMALDQLVLVKPKQFPHSEAIARASGADDVLANARVVDSVREALAGCGFVAATTSRDRDQYFRVADVRDAAERLVVESRRSPAAVLFGAERTGLTNDDLEAAHILIRIPGERGLSIAQSRHGGATRDVRDFPCSWRDGRNRARRRTDGGTRGHGAYVCPLGAGA